MPKPLPDEPLSLDYFAAGVPTAAYFRSKLDDLRKLSATDAPLMAELQQIQELCFIGLMSYFEAFCKDHFASILNVEPHLLQRLRVAGQNVDLDATRVLLFRESVGHRLGFLIAEKYDFGTAQKINALFGVLLTVTPFGKDEAQKYAAMLKDRNLLVHHSGTYTLTYLEQQTKDPAHLTKNAFWNSRVMVHDEVLAAIDFLDGIACKIVKATYNALIGYLAEQGVTYTGERAQALKYIGWFDDEPDPTG